ncbi:hypothetical protein Pelo_18329 [Pelomyxa schiedti]|nr:hypothetical protein Pelo_18329 [Pelomyxa schiedti]
MTCERGTIRSPQNTIMSFMHALKSAMLYPVIPLRVSSWNCEAEATHPTVHNAQYLRAPLEDREGPLVVDTQTSLQQPPSMVGDARTKSVGSHKGEVSFPGGKFDTGVDESFCDTALREAEEEVGLRKETVKVLGELEPYYVSTGFCIHPVIGVLTHPVVLTAAALDRSNQLSHQRHKLRHHSFLPVLANSLDFLCTSFCTLLTTYGEPQRILHSIFLKDVSEFCYEHLILQCDPTQIPFPPSHREYWRNTEGVHISETMSTRLSYPPPPVSFARGKVKSKPTSYPRQKESTTLTNSVQQTRRQDRPSNKEKTQKKDLWVAQKRNRLLHRAHNENAQQVAFEEGVALSTVYEYKKRPLGYKPRHGGGRVTTGSILESYSTCFGTIKQNLRKNTKLINQHNLEEWLYAEAENITGRQVYQPYEKCAFGTMFKGNRKFF